MGKTLKQGLILSKLFSFDLKAATDSLPVVLSEAMLTGLFGEAFAESWRQIMTQASFRSPEPLRGTRGRLYRFTKGQPLGYYSSWPVFALTHHMLVWRSAWQVYPGRKFLDYAILGDDIVIADEKVAAEYERLMDGCEVTISREKCLISHSGAMEFAKRFITDLGSLDFSPVSLKVQRTLCYSVASSAGPKGFSSSELSLERCFLPGVF